MRKQAATEAEGGQKVKIRGAGGVKNRLFLSFFAVKRGPRLPSVPTSGNGGRPFPQGAELCPSLPSPGACRATLSRKGRGKNRSLPDACRP